jgi:hypothetical protein
MRQDTTEQMKEFQASLRKMMEGNMTLVDDFGSIQLVYYINVTFSEWETARQYKQLSVKHFPLRK